MAFPDWPPVARLIDGPRDGDYVTMSWISQDQKIYRGDTIRVTFKQGILEPMGIARYKFDMRGNDGSYVHLFVDIDPEL